MMMLGPVTVTGTYTGGNLMGNYGNWSAGQFSGAGTGNGYLGIGYTVNF